MPRRRLDALLRALGGPVRDRDRPLASAIIETDPGATALDGLWQHMVQVWSELGREEPFWSVLPEARYRTAARPSARTLARFHASGRAEVERLESLLGRAGVTLGKRAVVAEYGCGVGRATRWLAERFARVRAFDLSAPHLARAEQHLEREGLGNVELVPLRRRQDLRLLHGFDLFFSRRVLQHNPPPLQRDILEHALAGLAPRGVACFQTITEAAGYAFRVADYARGGGRATDRLELHVLPQAAIFALARRQGLDVLAVHDDGPTERPGTRSNTFVMRKD